MISGGNFHGQPVALRASTPLPWRVAELANISERRIEQLVNPHLSSGLPPFLAPDSGLHSGFMIAQVSAAALVSENKILAPPRLGRLDPVVRRPRGSRSRWARPPRSSSRRSTTTSAPCSRSSCCAAAQGIDLRRPLTTTRPLEAIHAAIRLRVPRRCRSTARSPPTSSPSAPLIDDGSLLDGRPLGRRETP